MPRRTVQRPGGATPTATAAGFLSIEASQRVPCLLHQRLKRRVGVPPQLQQAGVVLDSLLSLASALVDLGQPEMGRASVQVIVRQSSVPGQSVLMTSKLK